ncbi:hypothetical protein [Algoriphagus boritolerans]|uniref:hypothetical protein n=1 Tax=Algoriphagus boritolerans TaxID=308111 RepID=UPI000AA079B1
MFDLADYVKASLKVFENVCTIDNPDFAVGEFSAFQVLCAGLGALAPQVFLACEGLAFAFTATCLVGEALKFADIANSEFLNRKFQEDIILYPKVYSSIPYQIGNSEKANPNGPFPDLFVDLGAKTGLRTLNIDPAFPQDGQDYRAVADFKCLTSGSLVEISVLGSDGYQDNISFSISATQPDKSYVLTVPGADSGVRDDINLVVKDLNGIVISRKASIVFN